MPRLRRGNSHVAWARKTVASRLLEPEIKVCDFGWFALKNLLLFA